MKCLAKADRTLLLHNLAQLMIQQFSDLARNKLEITIALPGGNSIATFLPFLLENENLIDFDRLIFYLADERISNNVNELNENQLMKIFFNQLEQPAITRFDLAANYRTYNKEFTAANRQLDIVFLGVGDDGHVASVFPEKPFLDYNKVIESGDLYLPVSGAPKPPPDRITLSAKSIREAGLVILLFLGKEKRQALENFRDETVPAGDCPAKLFSTGGDKVWLVTDLEP